MSMQTRTALALIMRQHEMGLLSDTEAYHAVCTLIIQEEDCA